MQSLVVTIPTPGDAGGTSAPTGMVFNPSSDFKGDKFIMVTEEGTVAGWQDGTTAVIRVDASASEAIYKGAALVTQANVATLAAANFHNGTVDIYDKTYQPVASTTAFTDTTIPAGFAPFNVVSIGNDVYVTYAKQDADKEDDVAGVGNGYVNQFDVTGQFVRRLVSTGTLNSPWAVVRAASFGALANTLLIGNFGDGKVYAYDPTTGVARGQLVDAANAELRVDGLWALVFGPARGADGGVAAASDAGTSSRLFFTAGPDGEEHESSDISTRYPDWATCACPAVRRRTAGPAASSDSTRADVVVHAEVVLGVVALLDLCESSVIHAIGRLHPIGTFVSHQEVHVGTAQRIGVNCVPELTRPTDDALAIRWIGIDAHDDLVPPRVAMAEGRLGLSDVVHRAIHRIEVQGRELGRQERGVFEVRVDRRIGDLANEVGAPVPL